MANQEHLNILKQGVKAWNEWREQHFDFRGDLDRITDELQWANLNEVNFMDTKLDWTNLWKSDLSKANLSYTSSLLKKPTDEFLRMRTSMFYCQITANWSHISAFPMFSSQ